MVNSDDPAYFGGYMTANFRALATHLQASREQLRMLSLNAVEACWLDDKQKRVLRERILVYGVCDKQCIIIYATDEI